MTGPQFDCSFSCCRVSEDHYRSISTMWSLLNQLHHTWGMKLAPFLLFTLQVETYKRKISFLLPTQYRSIWLIPIEGKPNWKACCPRLFQALHPLFPQRRFLFIGSGRTHALKPQLQGTQQGTCSHLQCPGSEGGLPPSYTSEEHTAGVEQAAHDRQRLKTSATGSHLTRATVIATSHHHTQPFPAFAFPPAHFT